MSKLARGLIELVLNVYRNTGLSAEEISRMLSLPEEFVEEVLDMKK